MRFDDAIWLLLALIAIPLGVVGWWRFASMSPLRRVAAIGARVLLLLLLAAMLAGVASVRTTNRFAVVAIVDVSGSVQRFADQVDPRTRQRVSAIDAARDFLERATAKRGPEDLLGVVAFDGRAIAVATPTRAPVLDRDLTPADSAQQADAATDIAGAIRLARTLIPPDATGRLVLISDGVETRGEALRAVEERAGRLRVPVDVVPLAFSIQDEVVVERLDAPPTAASDVPITLRVVLSATTPSTGTIRILREGEPIDANGDEPGTGLRVSLEPGRNVVPVEVEPSSGRVHRFRAVYEPDVVAQGGRSVTSGDTAPDNNVADAFTITPGRGVVLLVDGVGRGRESAGSPLANALRAGGLEVRVVSPDGMPRDILSLEDFDLVVLENVAAEYVPDATQHVLADFVRDIGGGLVMVGGPEALGAGGWRNSTIEPLLPVELELPDRLVSAQVATVLVLDNSGSMHRTVMGTMQTQQEIANEAAALAILSLDRRDEIGVITFNNDYRVVVPLAPNSDPQRTAIRVRGIGSDGGTFAPPAVEEGMRMLAASDAKVKHLVLVTDGKSRDNDRLMQLGRALKQRDIRLTTIAVGDDADIRSLETMARNNDGVSYQVTNPEVLPRIFLKAVRIVRSPLIKEAPITPIVLPTGSPMTAGLESAPPMLSGLVLTAPRPEPTITMAMATSEGEPLLAHWNAGLGQVVVFASDAGGGAENAWAQNWLDWPGYQRLWTNIARQAARPGVQRGVRAEATIDGSDLRVTLEAMDAQGHPLPGVVAPVTVYGPTGEAVDVRLAATAPGVYEARLPVRDPGSYVAVVKPQRDGTRMSPVVTGATAPRGSEYRALSANAGLLTQLASASGGRVLDVWNPEGAALFDRSGVPSREALTPLWPILMPLVIGVFLLDVAMRRVAWDRWVGGRFGVRAAEVAASGAMVGGLVGGVGAKVREVARGAEAAPTLGEADAEALRLAARDRRRAAKLGAYQADVASATPPAPAMPASAPVMSASGPAVVERAPESRAPIEKAPPKDEGAGSLLSAKRRARERYEE